MKIRDCFNCEKPFTPDRHQQRHCSPECRSDYAKKRRVAEYQRDKHKRKPILMPDPICTQCGITFPRYLKQRTCSEKCRVERKRQQDIVNNRRRRQRLIEGREPRKTKARKPVVVDMKITTTEIPTNSPETPHNAPLSPRPSVYAATMRARRF